MCSCACMLVLEWKERAFMEKWTPDVFVDFQWPYLGCLKNRPWKPSLCFLDIQFVYQNCTQIWRLHTKLYNGAWNVLSNNSETVGDIDLRLGQIVYIYQSFVKFRFLGFFYRMVSIYFLCRVYWVTVKMI